jgi:hypothetical protein
MPAVAITIAPAISTWHMIDMVAKSWEILLEVW